MKKTRFRYGAFSTLLLCVALAVLILLNVVFSALEKKNAWRVDYSFNALTSYGQVTEKVLDQLQYPVHIYALYAKGQEDQPLLQLLARYSAASSLITWEQTDITANPGLAASFRSATSEDSPTNNSLLVWCETTGRWRLLKATDLVSLSYDYDNAAYAYAGLTYESSLTSAIAYVSKDTVPRIMILQGHGELDEDGTELLASLLHNNHYDVAYFTLNTQQTSLTPADLLLILSPVRDLTDVELQQITEFTEAGGCILFTCDYSDPIDKMPNMTALLRSYGFLPQSGVVVADASEKTTYYNNNRIQLIPHMESTDITASMVSGGDTFLLLPAARGFAMPEQEDRYLGVEAVLTTSENAYLRRFSNGSMSLSRQADDVGGPLALALQASRMSGTGDVSRAFILGCSGLLTSQDEYAMTVAQEFILRTVNWLLGEEDSGLAISARAAIRPALSTASVTFGSLVITMLPMSVLAAAILVLRYRRHR